MASYDNLPFDQNRENYLNTITKRFDINVGFSCNMRCTFCYYLTEIERGTTKDISTTEIMRRLRVGREWNKTAVDFTGGEPTLRKDLPDLIRYARRIGYKTVCIITNGWKIGSVDNYIKKLSNAGLNDILISVHGASLSTHDGLTGRNGAFIKTMKAAEKVQATKTINLRFNYVVCQENFNEVEQAADKMASFNPTALNFILFQPTRTASHAPNHIRFKNYREAVVPIKKAINTHKKTIPHINVRDIPYCLLKGYESHVKPLYQLQYEKVEWDYCLDVLFKKKKPYLIASVVFGSILSLSNPYFLRCDWNNKFHMALQKARIFTMRKKAKKCKKCSVNHICDGLVKDYFNKNGADELIPYSGKRITNPTYFMDRDEIE